MIRRIRYWFRLRRRLRDIRDSYAPSAKRHHWVAAKWSLTPYTSPIDCRECIRCRGLKVKMGLLYRMVDPYNRWMISNVVRT